MSPARMIFRVHAIQRMFERGIDRDAVQEIACNGQVIESDADQLPYPGFVKLGFNGGRPIHVVLTWNVSDNEIVIITVYEPDLERWEPGFRRRR